MTDTSTDTQSATDLNAAEGATLAKDVAATETVVSGDIHDAIQALHDRITELEAWVEHAANILKSQLGSPLTFTAPANKPS